MSEVPLYGGLESILKVLKADDSDSDLRYKKKSFRELFFSSRFPCTGVAQNQGNAPPLGWFYAPMPTGGP